MVVGRKKAICFFVIFLFVNISGLAKKEKSQDEKFENYVVLKNENNMFVSMPNEHNRPQKPDRKERDSEQGYEDKLRDYNRKYTNYIKNIEHNLKCKYENMFNQRNRLAHNTLSYQQNLPTLTKLVNETQESRNYFIWFGLLTLIDNIFMELYRLYQDGLEEEINY